MSSGHIVKYNFKLKCKYFATLNVVFNSIHHTSIGDILLILISLIISNCLYSFSPFMMLWRSS